MFQIWTQWYHYKKTHREITRIITPYYTYQFDGSIGSARNSWVFATFCITWFPNIPTVLRLPTKFDLDDGMGSKPSILDPNCPPSPRLPPTKRGKSRNGSQLRISWVTKFWGNFRQTSAVSMWLPWLIRFRDHLQSARVGWDRLPSPISHRLQALSSIGPATATLFMGQDVVKLWSSWGWYPCVYVI